MINIKNYLTNIKSHGIIQTYRKEMIGSDNGKEIIIMQDRKEKATGKIKATAAPARVFLIIVGIILLAVGTTAMAGAFIVQSKGLPSGNGLLGIHVAETKQQAAGILVAKALLIWLEANVLFEIGRMFGRIAEDGLPFKPLGRSFKICGVLLMIGMFLPDLIGFAVTCVLCRLGSEVISWELSFNMHLELLMIAVIVLVLSRIFEYGVLLQQESDDTV